MIETAIQPENNLEFSNPLVHNKSSSVLNAPSPSYRDTILQSENIDLLPVEYIYAYFDQKNHTEKLWRLRSCRTGAFFMRNSETGKIRISSQSCHLRHCPLCSKTKSLTIKNNTTEWLKTARYPKLLTFTLKHNSNPLPDQIDKLYNSFRQIRRSSLLKKKCDGGVWFFQVKKSENDGLFHPHIHCLVAGSFLPHAELSRKWLKITGDSKIVDIRPIKDPIGCAQHVARYAANPCSLKGFSLDECVEVAIAFESRRICGTWGICRKLKLTSIPEFEKGHWYRLASWSAVVINKDVDDNAKAIFNAYRKGEFLEVGINLDHLFSDDSQNKLLSARPPPPAENQKTFEWNPAA
ncbi:hypothetical protein ES703_94851 [subsurface metagenome]